MKTHVLAVSFMVVFGGLANGCDSGKSPEPAPAEPTVTTEAEPEGEPSMEAASSSTEPMALSASGDGAGVGDNNEGVNHFQQGHLDVAQEHFQKALAANANLAEAHYNLALTLDKLGNHGEAANHFKMALELAPENPSIKDSAILQAHVKG